MTPTAAPGRARPGQAIVQTGPTWHYALATYLSSAERRAIAARHAEQAVSWQQLLDEDAAALPPAPIPAQATRLDHFLRGRLLSRRLDGVQLGLRPR